MTAARIGPAHGAHTKPSAAPTPSPDQKPDPRVRGPNRASRDSGAWTRSATAGISITRPNAMRTTIATVRAALPPTPTPETIRASATIVTVNVAARPSTMPSGRRRPPSALADRIAGSTGRTHGVIAVPAPATNANAISRIIGRRPVACRGNHPRQILRPGELSVVGSAADRRHRARGLDEPGLADVVLELLAPDRVPDDARDLGVARPGAQRAAQIGLVQREQAGAQPAIGGEPDAVAVGAERLGDRVDEADPAVGVGEAVDAGGGARLARLGDERVDRLDRGADLLAGEHLRGRPRPVGVERHELDEPHLVGGRARQAREGQDLLLGEAAHRDRVDVDRVRLGEGGEQLEPLEHLGERVTPSELVEAITLQ